MPFRLLFRRFHLLLIVALVSLLAAARPAAAVETGFLNKKAQVGGDSLPYVVYVPRDYSSKQRRPVILFLHGSGERGDDGLAQTQVGIATAIRLHPDRFPCLVVMPQAPSSGGWSGRSNELALRALDDVVKKYHGDPSRLYLTGLSMGGFGSWEIAAAHPDRFAAVMPICGGGDPSAMAASLKALPIWVFHGDADPAVPVQRSRDMVEAIKAAGNPNVRYTEYPGVGHNAWDKAYGDSEVIVWLLNQKRSDAHP